MHALFGILLKNKLQVTQNKIIRFVFNMYSRAYLGSGIFKFVYLLRVSKRVDQIILNHVLRLCWVNLQSKIILRLCCGNLQSILFWQIPYTQLELDLGKLGSFYSKSQEFWKVLFQQDLFVMCFLTVT